jgi:hypothetical protein
MNSLLSQLEAQLPTLGVMAMGSKSGRSLYLLSRKEFTKWAKSNTSFSHTYIECFLSNLEMGRHHSPNWPEKTMRVTRGFYLVAA